mgnify:CR=1 FL=1
MTLFLKKDSCMVFFFHDIPKKRISKLITKMGILKWAYIDY